MESDHIETKNEERKTNRVSRARLPPMPPSGAQWSKEFGEPGDLGIELTTELAIARPFVDEAERPRRAARPPSPLRGFGAASRTFAHPTNSLPHSIGIA